MPVKKKLDSFVACTSENWTVVCLFVHMENCKSAGV